MSNALPSEALSVLVVDDDRYGLTFLRSSLRIAGYTVTTAEDAEIARTLLEERGPSAFHAILTDFRMPRANGIALLRWARTMDPTLATVLITAEGEREIVKEALAGGAFGFLEKPVAHQLLVETMRQAVASTVRQRRLEHHAAELAAVGRLDEFLNAQVGPELAPHFRLFYRPVQEIGGDFLSVRERTPDQHVIFAGDVSGHNVTAGYVSSFFQGLARAGLETGQPAEASIRLFNQILCQEWAPAAAARGELVTSLALVVLEIDLNAGTWRALVAGFPPPWLIDEDGFPTSVGSGGPPLGWLVDGLPASVSGALRGVTAILLYSDGLLDWADELGLDPLALSFRLLEDQSLGESPPSRPADDVFLARYQPVPAMSPDSQFQPIIHESYTGAEADGIDELEAIWRRSLLFALGERVEERIFDLVVCLREAVLNALVHGCEGNPAKVATLDVSFRASDHRVRIRVDDPGRGHRFDLEARLRDLPFVGGRQLGLGMIQHLSDHLTLENGGTSVLFDFVLKD